MVAAVVVNMVKELEDPEPVFVNLLRSPGIDSQPGGPGPVQQPYLSYSRPPDYKGLRNLFLGSINVQKYGLRQAAQIKNHRSM
jgi:hypothetical protein